VILVVIFTALAFYTLMLPVFQAVVWGIVAMLLYWLSETLHQYGHYWAGRQVGYPMTGVRLWWFWGASQYPADEPTLPGAVHIRRALGGAPMSIAIGVVVGLIALVLRDSLSPSIFGLLALFALLNLVYFGFGAFLPLGFTDGSTLLHYWGKR
jgi:hypothetical protein